MSKHWGVFEELDLCPNKFPKCRALPVAVEEAGESVVPAADASKCGSSLPPPPLLLLLLLLYLLLLLPVLGAPVVEKSTAWFVCWCCSSWSRSVFSAEAMLTALAGSSASVLRQLRIEPSPIESIEEVSGTTLDSC
eukprot:CAMPEP_0206568836 /NCGR_PEP_ID=MMETSP0325_2-20121206/26070_1 /ASSEMBLY_ACC=CAM_ASM_000347 /TAXON_ID=2866 /ORGANISM="Crypthecodinium cohnii, Strain Seligo" /LENGTH=135 /DNA_ID=CAMNT_0054072291 /DNA_START=68 /DNA_END=471 /DNA_ORIENTATION=-